MNHPTAKPAILAPMALLFLGMLLPMKVTGEDRLPSYRQIFLATIASQTLPLELSYAERLPALERSFAEKKDYVAAEAVAEEIRQTEKRIETLRAALQVATPKTNAKPSSTITRRIVLTGAEAKFSPDVRLDRTTGAIVGFERPGSWAKWTLPGQPAAGGYEVVLNYSCGEGEGGDVEVQEDFFLLPATILSTGPTQTVKGAAVGTLRLSEANKTLRIVAKKVVNSSLMQLRSVELIPASTSGE